MGAVSDRAADPPRRHPQGRRVPSDEGSSVRRLGRWFGHDRSRQGFSRMETTTSQSCALCIVPQITDTRAPSATTPIGVTWPESLTTSGSDQANASGLFAYQIRGSVAQPNTPGHAS